jgi:ferritin-like metal-binding protein YciE
MNINGRYMEDGEALRRLNEVKTAISKTLMDHPLRGLLDFLTGYIDAQDEMLEEAKTDSELLKEAKETVEETENQIDELETKLSEVRNNPDPALAPLIALKL